MCAWLLLRAYDSQVVEIGVEASLSCMISAAVVGAVPLFTELGEFVAQVSVGVGTLSAPHL